MKCLMSSIYVHSFTLVSGHTAFGLALYQAPADGQFAEDSFAVKLLQKGSSVDALNDQTGTKFQRNLYTGQTL